jgi:putative oxidoreductase
MSAILNILGRFFFVLIFLMSAIGNKIPNYGGTVKYMESEGVPAPMILLAGAIVFLIAGGLSILVGFKAKIGATLLLIFLILANYWFHDFWTFDDAQVKQTQTIAFMKNLALIGGTLMIIARGSGAGSLDRKISKLD